MPSYDLIAIQADPDDRHLGTAIGFSVTRCARAEDSSTARTLSGIVLMADDIEIEDHGAADSPHPNLVFEGRTDVFLT